MTIEGKQEGSAKERVATELSSLRSDLKAIGDDIRSKVGQAGEEAKDTWTKLQSERDKFLQKLDQAADETGADLRQMGSDLKRRLKSLRDELASSGSTEPKSS